MRTFRSAQHTFRELVEGDPECTDEMRLKVPRVFDELSTDQMLVTERVRTQLDRHTFSSPLLPSLA